MKTVDAAVAADESLKQLIKDVLANASKKGDKGLKVIIEQLLHFKKAQIQLKTFKI